MKVLVTGANGFLGRYVVEQLAARGDAVRGLYRTVPIEPVAGVEQVFGDIADGAAVGAACRGVDAVIHTAATAGIWGPWNLFHTTNVVGTRNVVDGCRRHGVRRLVFTSSPSVTFDGRPQRNVDESAPYPRRWLGYYSQTKAEAERLALAAHEAGRLHTCALRPHLIWGPRDRHLIPRLLDRARSGKLQRVGRGDNRIDVTYVDNAAAAHLAALDRLAEAAPLGGRAYFISQGEPVDCWSWIDEILRRAGLPNVRRSVSLPVAYCAGKVLEGVWKTFRLGGEPRMTRFLALQLATDHFFDIGAARRDLGYVPQVSTAQGMERLGAWLSATAEPIRSG